MLKEDIHLKFSKIYLAGLSLIMFASLGSIYLCDFKDTLAIILFLFVIFYGFYCINTMRCFRAIKSLGENRWILTIKNRSYVGYLCGDSTVTSKICVLRFKLVDHRLNKTYLILRDSVDKGIYRALLVELYASRANV